MKQTILITLVFVIAFATSLLLDIELIFKNNVRYTIVVAFIIVEFIIGFLALKEISKPKK